VKKIAKSPITSLHIARLCWFVIRWCIMGLVIKLTRTGTTSRSLSLQWIVIPTWWFFPNFEVVRKSLLVSCQVLIAL